MRVKRQLITVLIVILSLIGMAAWKVKLDFSGDHEGFFVLRGKNGAWLELTDDLFPEDSDRMVWGSSLTFLKKVSNLGVCIADDKPCLNYEWNASTGRGFIKTTFPDGRKLLICLGRFKDSSNQFSSGLFLGGDLPPGDPDFRIFDKNESGMAYYDGKRYFHIWCNVNEGLFDSEKQKPVYPSEWQFLSSQVLEQSPRELTIVSRHRTYVNQVPLNIQRFLHYNVGDTYVTLVTMFLNAGEAPASFSYIYGDEPWLGDFGTSVGNIGWISDRLIKTESEVDPRRYTYAGLFDYGNDLIGEGHDFTGKANFIEWQKSNPPDLVYFANQFGDIAPPEKPVPLSSKDNRVIALQYGPRVLQPGETYTFSIAVGMAGNDPKTGFPVKPVTTLN